MTASQLRPKKRSRQDRQPDILAAARELLEKRGLDGFSMADVAASAKVSEATVFYYFATRRHLMFRVISDWMEPAIARLENDLRALSTTRERLALFITRHLQQMAEAPGMHRLIYRELQDDNYLTSPLHSLNQRYTRTAVWIVNQGKASREVRESADARLTRDLLFGGLQHIGWRTLLRGRSLNIERTSEQLAEQFYLGICAAAPSPAQASAPALEAVIARLERLANRMEQS